MFLEKCNINSTWKKKCLVGCLIFFLPCLSAVSLTLMTFLTSQRLSLADRCGRCLSTFIICYKLIFFALTVLYNWLKNIKKGEQELSTLFPYVMFLPLLLARRAYTVWLLLYFTITSIVTQVFHSISEGTKLSISHGHTRDAEAPLPSQQIIN